MSHVLIRRWRRLDEPGLEIFRLVPDEGGYRATSAVTFGGAQRQRYEQLAEQRWRFTFIPTGFVAEIQFDDDSLVAHFEGLAEAF